MSFDEDYSTVGMPSLHIPQSAIQVFEDTKKDLTMLAFQNGKIYPNPKRTSVGDVDKKI